MKKLLLISTPIFSTLTFSLPSYAGWTKVSEPNWFAWAPIGFGLELALK